MSDQDGHDKGGRAAPRDARSYLSEASSLSELVATLTHELKTPLHSMLSLCDVLSSEIDGSLSDEQQRQVEMIRRNGEVLLEMILELLSYSSISHRIQHLRASVFDAKQFLDELVETQRSVAVQKQITIDADISKAPKSFGCDQMFLRHIVNNLLNNAIKFSTEDSVVSIYAWEGQNGALEIEVADSGQGISLSGQEKIFDTLEQGDRAKTAERGSVGLGLALVKASLESLGGKLEVQSEEDKGALFHIMIPNLEHEVEVRQAAIFETDATSRLIVGECLRKAGFKTLEFSSFSEVDAGKLETIDIIITSVEELVNASEAGDLQAGFPVIALSPIDSKAEREQASNAGALDFLVKPFDVDDLVSRVFKVIGGKLDG